MAQILRIDATGGDAYVQSAISAGGSSYFRFCIYLPSSTLDDLAVQSNWIDILQLRAGGSFLDGLFLSFDDSPGAGWQWWWDIGPGGPVGTVTPDEWHTLEWRVDSDGGRLLRADGVELVSGTIANPGTPDVVRVGSVGFGSYPGVWWYDDFTIGTTSFGSTDVYDDDFDAGLGGWGSVVGGATADSDGVTGGGCGAGAALFLSVSPATLSVPLGGSDDVTVTVGGVTESIDLSASGLPAGVSVGFSPDPVSSPGSSTATVTVSLGTAPGVYTITVTGTGASGSAFDTFLLVIAASENTTCEAALVISGTTGSMLADNSDADGFDFATDPLFNNECWGFGEGGGGPLWWKFTNPFSRPVMLRIRIDEGPADSIESAVLGIFRGTCADLVTDDKTTTDGFGRDFSGRGYTGVIDVPAADPDVDYVEAGVAPGETVYVEVDGYSGDTTDPVTLGEPNRGTFEFRWIVLSILARDGIEDSVFAGEPFCAPNGDSYLEPGSSVLGATDDTIFDLNTAHADDYVELAGDSWYTVAWGNVASAPTARVLRWDGATVTEYVLPISGIWEQTEVQLATDGEHLWAVTHENGGPTGDGWTNPRFGHPDEPANWNPAYPVVFRYDAGGDEFVVDGRMEPRSANVYRLSAITGDAFVGRVGSFDVTAHESQPGRCYVVWSEKGADGTALANPDYELTGNWIEHAALGCFGPSAPFSDFDIGLSTTAIADALLNAAYANDDSGESSSPIGDFPFYLPVRGLAMFANDQGVCQLFYTETQIPAELDPGAGGPYLGDRVLCYQVEDGGTLTLKQTIEWESPAGSGLPEELGNAGYMRGFGLEPVAHEETALDSARAWGFVRQGDAFPGDHPDWTILPLLGVSGVLWRDTDPTFTLADLTATRSAGFDAGMWTDAGSGQSAASFVAQASDIIDDFAPDLLVLDVETRYGTDPSANWTWHEDVMSALAAAYPSQPFAVTMGPIHGGDFNFAAYTSRGVEIWPQSYPGDISDCSFDPVAVFDDVVSVGGVDPSFVAPVLSADCYPDHVAVLAAAGHGKWSVFTLDDRPAFPESGPGSPAGELRTLIVTWEFASVPTGDPPTQTRHLAYNIDPLLVETWRWFNNNAQANGADVLVLFSLGTLTARDLRRTLFRDSYGETWGFHRNGGAVFFDRNCSRGWEVAPHPFVDEAVDAAAQRNKSGRQVVWHEDGDFVRTVTEYATGSIPQGHHLAIAHMQLLRRWRICDVGNEVEDVVAALLLMLQFRASPSSADPGSIAAAGTHLSRIRFRARPSGAEPASVEDFSPNAHLSRIGFRAG